MRIAVGSANPVKVAAVRLVISRKWPDAEIVSVAVPSGIGEMPMSDEETMTGARNRATAARAAAGADFGIGLEGGVQQQPYGLTLQGWAIVVDGNGREGIGGGTRLLLPPDIASRILAGEELGPVMDELLGETDIKKKGGAVGALTNGLILRRDAFVIAVAFALAPFVSPDFYGQK